MLVQADNISVEFKHHTALQNVSLKVRRGEIVTLIGPNGAGKSTLVRVVLGLSIPQQGAVLRQDNICIGYMPQHLHIDPVLPLTVARFINLSGTNVQSILEEVGVVKLLNRPLQNISGGEMRRVLLARALLRHPDLLVLDEPIQGVDVAGQYELYELIAQIRNRHGCGILMVSHDLHLVMAATDQVICLNRHICCSGHPETVTKHPAYLELFGARAARDLAIYTHHHQ
ncbi:MAG: zinc ABC transporter ATP-binding protein ZnuC [Candidatus Marithrix sp.]|nr:zinc ABC transporter ATP-binding protein ZnuC [Candidatus Marithrix sp.]